eukprot:TRINITY_DN62193_c0_g1_i1.p1 TRINITY_DN62193_c0_g1~~TRINITY_DN62193_c0_g1_i1.p1  ORF type:complete len:750 (-),score=109.73 TRINITY_DN62193_c0_g1_i1:461-2677(-)
MPRGGKKRVGGGEDPSAKGEPMALDVDVLLADCQTALQRGDYAASVRCFDRCLESCQGDAIDLDKKTQFLVGRSRAFVGLGRYVRAFRDAEVATMQNCSSSEAWLQRGVCEDALGLHEQAMATLRSAAALCHESSSLHLECERAKEAAQQRYQEQMYGHFRWAELYQLHGSAEGLASFCHPAVTVRLVPGRGRGLFVSTEVGESELLFACKAFATAEKDGLLNAVIQEFERSPETIRKRLLCLFDGTNGNDLVPAELNMEGRPSCIVPGEEGPPCDEALRDRIEQILKFNTFARDTLTAYGASDDTDLCGLWMLPSFLNHACRPNVQRTFIGDMMICRAAQPLPAGSELVDTYVSPFQAVQLRRERLQLDHGFHCSCIRCVLEEKSLSSETVQGLLGKLDSIVESVHVTGLATAAKALDAVSEDALREARMAASSAKVTLAKDKRLLATCVEMWGQKAVDSTGLSSSARTCFERLLCAPFMAIFKGAAFIRKQTGEPALSSQAYQRCLDVLEEVSPGGAYHAHWAAERALQARLVVDSSTTTDVKGATASMASAARYARRWHAVCYGRAAFKSCMERCGWPASLIDASDTTLLQESGGQNSRERDSCSQEDPGRVEGSSKEDIAVPGSATRETAAELAVLPQSIPSNLPEVPSQWDWSLDHESTSLILSIAIPMGVEPSDLQLDVASERVVVVCSTPSHGNLGSLRVALPRLVNPDGAPPAKYKKKNGRRLILQLPFP